MANYSYLGGSGLAELQNIKRKREMQDQLLSSAMAPRTGKGGGLATMLGSIATALMQKGRRKELDEREKALLEYSDASAQADRDIIAGAQPDELSRVLMGSPNPLYQKMGAALLTAKKPRPRKTPAMINAEALGLTPGTPEYNEFIQKKSGPQQINIGAKREEAAAKAEIDKVMIPALDAAKSSREKLSAYDNLERTLDAHMAAQPGFLTKPGAYPEARLSMAKAAQLIPGVDVEGLDKFEDIQRQISQMTVTQLGSMKGSPSDADMMQVMQSIVNASQSAESMKQSIAVGKAVEKWNAAYNDRLAEWVKQGNPVSQFDSYIESVKKTDQALSSIAQELDTAIESLPGTAPEKVKTGQIERKATDMSNDELLKGLGL